ncbi:MAG: hypothetical protein PHF20_05830 [Halothiobacillaceae bacterium]|nr:hypothetical protein [Halothiobacillaceae bacterium]
MKLYITPPSIFMLVIFYLPLVLWVLWRIWRSPRWRGAKKAGVMTLTVLLAYAIPLGDVTVNSIAMAKVCPSAGLHVYRTVEVEGYLTEIGDGKILKKYPYLFIETPQLKTDGTYYWGRYKTLPDGTVSYERVDQPKAEFEVVSGQWHVDGNLGVEVLTDVVRNRISGEVLAAEKLFNPLPGWMDKILVIRWFGSGGRRGCWGEPSSMVDVSRILIPKQSNN